MRLTVATGDYAHTRGLRQAGAPVGHDDVALERVVHRPRTIFRRALEDPPPFDVAEMSLAGAYVLAAERDPRFVALPVFPSRMFRYAALYVRPGLRSPRELRGARFGAVRYGQTATVWVRAALEREHGVAHRDLSWWVAETPPRAPAGIEVAAVRDEAALEAMLAAGELDCMVSVEVPGAFRDGRVSRLFPDYAERERAALAAGDPLPVMHTVVVRRALVDAHPWLAPALVRAFAAARDEALAWLGNEDYSSLPVPLQHGWLEASLAAAGGDPWPYGLAANRAVLDAFADHMHAQGLTPRRVAPDEVFVE